LGSRLDSALEVVGVVAADEETLPVDVLVSVGVEAAPELVEVLGR
jgi:hypothetical protein